MRKIIKNLITLMVLRLMTRTSEDAESKNENDGSAAYAPENLLHLRA